jgi:hypothetical protein
VVKTAVQAVDKPKQKAKKKPKPSTLARFRSRLVQLFAEEREFLSLIGILIVVIAVFYRDPAIAMWIGFALAAYSAIGNDSIQTLGTFIESNKKRPWWVLWLFMGSVFLITMIFGWSFFDGDVTYQRLIDSADNTRYPHPEEFRFVQILAPLVLLCLTRMRMPVSTTFLLLSVFSSTSSGVISMVTKSLSGYLMAGVLSFCIWFFGYRLIKKYYFKRTTNFSWTIVQWTVSGALWSVWLMQDGANIAVFLPRRLDQGQFVAFLAVIFFGMAILLRLRGDRIQRVVSEKKRISDVRAATLVDFTFVIMLLYKLFISTVPMSTTWVFLGVIGGREIAISHARKKKGSKHRVKAYAVVGRDMVFALIGLVVSVILASFANDAIRADVLRLLGGIIEA